MTATRIDAAWRAAHPLPRVKTGTDKNARGRVLLVGGARFVPGAPLLTGEAALRAGAGKLQIATVETVAMALGVLMPEAAMIPLPMREDGEIAAAATRILADVAAACDCLILGPGMRANDDTGALVSALLAARPGAAVMDAAALADANVLAQGEVPMILTPHHGEMAALSGENVAVIDADPPRAARAAAKATGGLVVLKSKESWIATPDGRLLHFDGGCAGLATGGSGDVLAGIIGGLLARGADPATAAGWGVWLHGEAGQRASRDIGPTGFLARDLLPYIPRLMAEGSV